MDNQVTDMIDKKTSKNVTPIYPEMNEDVLKVVSEFMHPRSSFFDVYPELLDWVVEQHYDAKTRTVYGLKHSRYDDPFLLIVKGCVSTATWYRFGREHRDHGPAVITVNVSEIKPRRLQTLTQEEITENMISYRYYYRGFLHRTDGPAIVGRNREGWYNLGVHIPFGNNKSYIYDIKITEIPQYVSKRFWCYPRRRHDHIQPSATIDNETIKMCAEVVSIEHRCRFEVFKHYDWAIEHLDNPVDAKFIEMTEDIRDIDERGKPINIYDMYRYIYGSSLDNSNVFSLDRLIGAALERRRKYIPALSSPAQLSVDEQAAQDALNMQVVYDLFEKYARYGSSDKGVLL